MTPLAAAPVVDARLRPVWSSVDLRDIEHNARVLHRLAAPAELCAVVKADGFGHGAVEVAGAALRGGATWLAVALVEEGAALRRAGITAPVLVLSEPPPAAMAAVVALRLVPAVYTARGIRAAARVASEAVGPSLPVHLKVDTGMHRVGATPDDAVALALAIAAEPSLELGGIFTHYAVADHPVDPFTEQQRIELERTVDVLASLGLRPPLVHACNSAGVLTSPASHRDLVRCGVALYGLAPSPALDRVADLHEALSLHAEVSFVKDVPSGTRVSYGRRYTCHRPSRLATVPLGYADGVPRRLSDVGGEVLIRGVRRRIAGAITMDQLLVDCGDDRTVEPGDEVVLLGQQGGARVTSWEWAERLGTIAHEIVCGLTARVPRRYER